MGARAQVGARQSTPFSMTASMAIVSSMVQPLPTVVSVRRLLGPSWHSSPTVTWADQGASAATRRCRGR